MKSVMIVVLGLLIAPQGDAIGKVETKFDKKADFSAFRLYAWTPGYNAFDPEAHKMIVAAFETEMSNLGFTKGASATDVTLAYYTVTGTDVDLKALDKKEREGATGPTTKARARLVVIMRSAASNQQVWSASTREYLDQDRAKLNDTIQSVTARLFNTYPGRKRAR